VVVVILNKKYTLGVNDLPESQFSIANSLRDDCNKSTKF